MMPRDMPALFLEGITGRFSVNNRVGSGGYGEVFKGVLTNGTVIAVKKLYDVQELDDEQFKNEFSNLMRVQHKNIIRFIGYCNETRFTPSMFNGEQILVRRIYKALCFEYLPHGSLDNHLFEESCGLDWCTRYKIIKGICEGLNYLHNGLEEPIFHLDLKPANILLDKNMMPKIADFGVSRPFRGTHTHTTRVCVGSEYYMPPEYMSKRQISNKNDIFSLGIIIIQTMTGLGGYTKYGEIESPQQFMELVISNWRHRIAATSNCVEEECQQVKRCIEIAVSCIDADRHRRPAISDILRELKETETYSTTSSSQDGARVAKIGQWGGAGGSNHCDLEVAPHRMESLTIFSGEVIYALEFSYRDHRGLQYTAGPWGGNGPNNKGSHRNEIQLALSEYVTEISGTVGPFDMAPAGVVTSLSFITNNARKYGPFGDVRGTHFRIPVKGNGSIVGFFVRAGWYLDAFGVYVNPKQRQQETVGDEEENKVPLAKIGPWGGNGGCPCDIMVSPDRLESVTIIHSDTVVSSLEFSYMDPDGVKHTAGPWGSSQYSGEETTCTIELGISEFLRALYGTTGPAFPDQQTAAGAAADDDVVTSLTLLTNTRRCGPFGRQAARGGTSSFHIPMRGDGSIVGFFGRADSSIHAIGVYANPCKQEGTTGHEAADELGKSGPWGGSGGRAHYIDDGRAGRPEPHHLVSVTIRFDSALWSHFKGSPERSVHLTPPPPNRPTTTSS
ncbi:hypothetical protein BS78_05G205900 [Paspalum vaginatum]|nr:hypothetical protein BS78_05G205900 [Paspalum vaginatum]